MKRNNGTEFTIKLSIKKKDTSKPVQQQLVK